MSAAVTTSKPINLSQLTSELGGVGLSMRGDRTGPWTVFTDGCTQAALEAAIAAHVAVDEESNATTLRSRAGTALQNNRDFLALATVTNADVVAQVKALTRQNNGIIRLILGRLEGTD